MSGQFLQIHPTDDPLHWTFDLTADVCVGPPDNVFMFGGVGLGAALQALERTTQQTVIWATAQYLAVARPGMLIDLQVVLSVQGRRTSQARVVGKVGSLEIFVVMAALSSGGEGPAHQWAAPPDMPSPLECSVAELWGGQKDNLNTRIDIRMAPGRFGEGPRTGQISDDGRIAFWIRADGGLIADTSLLAVFADYVPSGVGAAFGRQGGGNSLDNTLRVVGGSSTPWVLCDVRIAAAHNGMAHGAINMFSEAGLLLAIGAQSMTVRFL